MIVKTKNPIKIQNRLKTLLNSFALTSASALAALSLGVDSAHASRWFISGDTLYYTGTTSYNDHNILRDILDRATEDGTPIRRVVFRNATGGDAHAGVTMGRTIRDYGIDTVIDGGCFSACADSYIGGTNRYFTNYDLPEIGELSRMTFGIHGAADTVGPIADQEIYIDYYRELLGPEAFAIAEDRITEAHYGLITQGGFLYYLDPNAANNITSFCPTADRSSTGNCTEYPEHNIVTDGLATSGDYFEVNDRLFITGNVNTPISTGMENTYWFRKDFEYMTDWFVFEAPAAGDRHSTVHLLPGSHLNLNNDITAPYVIVDAAKLTLGRDSFLTDLEGMAIRNRGVLNLDGGHISGRTHVNDDSLITGRGSIGASTLIFGGNLLPHDIRILPYTLAPIAPNIREQALNSIPLRLAQGRSTLLADNSNLVFNVNAGMSEAPLKIIQARYLDIVNFTEVFQFKFGDNTFKITLDNYRLVSVHKKASLHIAGENNLLLNLNPDHYKNNQKVELAKGLIDTTPLSVPQGFCAEGNLHLIKCERLTAEALNKPVEDSSFIIGRFTKAGRVGDPSSLVDSTQDGAIIHARHNSLLTFSLFQNENEIYLTANPAFEDVALFGNKQSGNGLGEALKAASWDDNTRLGPVLGALQFSDRNVARRQASTLRGDGYSSLRLVSRSIVDQFSDALFNARQQVGGAAVNNPLAVAETLTLPGDRGERMGMGGGYAGTATLALDPAPTPRSPYDLDTPTQVFATGFGQMGVLNGQNRISRLEYNGFGTLIGASRELNQNTRVGAAIGYGQTRTNARPVNSFKADSDTLLGAVFADISHARGALSVQAGYAQITHDTTRNVFEIEGLETPSKAEFDNRAYFARLENGLDLGDRHGAQVTLLAPVVDFVNLQDLKVNENGLSPTNLRIENESFASLRAGLGLQIERQIKIGEGGVTPYARVVYQRELLDREARSTNNFLLAPGQRFESVSRQLGEDSVEWNLGLRSTTPNQNLNLAVEYQGRAIKGETGHGAQVSLKYRF